MRGSHPVWASTSPALRLSWLLQANASAEWVLDRPSSSPPPKPLAAGGLQLNLPPCHVWEGGASPLWKSVSPYMEALVGRPPLFVALRLFPDATVAHVSRQRRSHAVDGATGDLLREGSGRLQRIPTHHLALSAFTTAEDPWRTGVPPQRVLRQSLATLETAAASLPLAVPLLIIIPTRMLVTQRYCEALFTLARRAGWAGVAIEMPSTHTLFEPEPPQAVQANWEHHWCRLSTLCTPWNVLQRQKKFLPALHGRSCTIDTLLPLHVLLPWVLEQGLLQGVDVSTVWDTTAPLPGLPSLRAEWERPGILGEEEFPGDRAPAEKAERRLHMLQPIGPTQSSSSPVWEAATEAIRSKSAAVRDAMVTSGADLGHVERILRDCRPSSTAAADNRLADYSSNHEDGGLLAVPSEALKELFARSIIQEPPAAQRHDSFVQTDQFLQDAMAPSGGAVGKSEEADVVQGVGAFQQLLQGRSAPAADDLGCLTMAYEREMARLQRSAQATDAPAVVSKESESGGNQLPSWCTSTDDQDRFVSFGRGYWQCTHTWLRESKSLSVLTLPSLAATQVLSWYASLKDTASTQSLSSSTKEELPWLVPVLLPILSAAELETQRLLREGHVFTKAKRRDSNSVTEKDTDCCHWLPPDLETSLVRALDDLPASYALQVRSAALGGYTAASHNSKDHFTSELTADSEADDTADAGSAPAHPVESYTIKRCSHQRKPFWYQHPREIASQRQRFLADTASLHTAAEESTAQRAEAHFQHEVLPSAIQQAVRICKSPAVVLSVPLPGVTTSDIVESWNAILSH